MSQQNVPESDERWREILTDEEYQILREADTEPRFSGDLLDIEENGQFTCAGCGTELFHSDQKFESGSGWPSFLMPTTMATSRHKSIRATVCAAPRPSVPPAAVTSATSSTMAPSRPASGTASTPPHSSSSPKSSACSRWVSLSRRSRTLTTLDDSSSRAATRNQCADTVRGGKSERSIHASHNDRSVRG